MLSRIAQIALAVALIAVPTAVARADAGDDQFAVAAGHYSAARWELTIEEFRAYLTEYPQHAKQVKARFFLGEALVQLGRYEEAQQQFEAALKEDAQGRYARQSLFRWGECAWLAGNRPVAAEKLSKFSEQHANDALNGYALEYLGELALAAGKPGEAKEHFRKCLEKFPRGPSQLACKLGLAQAQVRLAELDAAEKLLKEVAKDPVVVVEAQYWLAQVHRSRRQWEAAASALAAAIEADPEHAAVETLRYQRADALVRAGRFTEAQDGLLGKEQRRGAADLPPSQRYLLAVAHQGLGQHAEALELLNGLAKEIEPSLKVNVWLAKATSHSALGQHLGAAAEYGRLLEEFTDDGRAPEWRMARAQALEKGGQPSEAVADYLLLAEKQPTSKLAAEGTLKAARVYDRIGHDADAAALYERLTSEYAHADLLDAALYGWAWCLRDLKRHDAAQEKFDRLYREFRDSRYWADATYRLASDAARRRDYDRAGELLDQIVDAAAKNRGNTSGDEGTDAGKRASVLGVIQPATLVHAFYLRAQVAVQRSRWERAREDLNQVLIMAGDAPLARSAEFLLADVAYRRGDYDEAEKRFSVFASKPADGERRWQPTTALRTAQILAQKKQWAEAQAAAERIIAEFPEFQERYEVDYLLGRCHAAQAAFDGARQCYLRVVRSPQGGKSETAAMAQWMIGETYFLQEQYNKAIREYLRVEILYAYPRWQAAALLQAAKCHEQLGQWGEAQTLYERIGKQYAKTEFVAEANERLQAIRSKTAAKKR